MRRRYESYAMNASDLTTSHFQHMEIFSSLPGPGLISNTIIDTKSGDKEEEEAYDAVKSIIITSFNKSNEIGKLSETQAQVVRWTV